jgi:hypothetical protein
MKITKNEARTQTDRETECAMGTGGRRGRNADGRELLGRWERGKC